MTARGWPETLWAGAVLLRPPRQRDARPWSRVRLRNEHWLSQWEPSARGSWAERNATSAWSPLCSALRRAGRAGTMQPYMIIHADQLVGQISVSNIVWGSQRSCTVGYWVDSAVAGRGIAPTALALVIDHLLSPRVGLHRVEVDIRPENGPSRRVAEKLGLRQEGYYERYLDIDGAWRDHLAFAVTAEEVAAAPMLSRLPAVPI